MTRGWRRFRRLPGVAQAAMGLALVAVYTVALVLILGGGGEKDGGGGSSADGPRAEPVAVTDLDKRVLRAVQKAPSEAPTETGDVAEFRAARVRRVRCKGESCDVVYSVGLPGRGRILVDQRPMIQRLFAQTDVVKATFTVTRDTVGAGVPPNPKGEETPSGAPLLRTTCDRSKHEDVRWASASGAQILVSICTVQAYDQGEVNRHEPVAPDDPAAKQPPLPGEE